MINLNNLTIKKAREMLDTGEVSALELTENYLKNISEKNKELNAYLEVFEDATDMAREADKRLALGERGGLLGVPLGIKDNILVKGHIASASSKILENYRAVYDATVVVKLKKAGAVFLGRTNMDEFAHGSSTENSAFGVTKNPIDTTRVSGGSSGGSAAAVASDMAIAALGSETGGSVRQPASLCGIVGLKTTYGAVSRHGLIAMGSSLDQIGPLAKSVDDAEAVFNVIKGRDSMDSTSRDYPAPPKTAEKMKIAVPKGFVGEGVDSEVIQSFNSAVERLTAKGHEVVEVDLPNIKYALAVYYVIMPAEVSTNLARFDGVRYGLHVDGEDLLSDYRKSRARGFGPEARRRIMLGTYVLSAGYYDAYYKKAGEVRSMLQSDFAKIFQSGFSAIITPTSPSVAFKIGEKVSDPLAMYKEDIFTVSANVVGIPAISIPSGFAERGGRMLPTGFQIMAPHFRENILFKLGRDAEL